MCGVVRANTDNISQEQHWGKDGLELYTILAETMGRDLSSTPSIIISLYVGSSTPISILICIVSNISPIENGSIVHHHIDDTYGSQSEAPHDLTIKVSHGNGTQRLDG